MKVFVKRFQWTGMIEWGQKPKSQKIPGPKIYAKERADGET